MTWRVLALVLALCACVLFFFFGEMEADARGMFGVLILLIFPFIPLVWIGSRLPKPEDSEGIRERRGGGGTLRRISVLILLSVLDVWLMRRLWDNVIAWMLLIVGGLILALLWIAFFFPDLGIKGLEGLSEEGDRPPPLSWYEEQKLEELHQRTKERMEQYDAGEIGFFDFWFGR